MNLKELSTHLGLSATTVSRALNGYPEVREETRRRVCEAAKLNNYRPNTKARSLATGRAGAIGHVLRINAENTITNPIFTDFISGASESYVKNGYDILIGITKDDDEENVYRELLAKGAVDGVILHGPQAGDTRIDMLHDIGMPFVVHGRSTGGSESYSWVDVNNRRSFQRATEFLLDLGHRRIALINGVEAMGFAIRRREGYEAALAQRAIALTPEFVRSAEMTDGNGYLAASELLALPNAPTAILVASIIPALGVRRAIEDCGLQMGRDVSVIIHDDDLSYFENGTDIPIYTATKSSVRKAGAIAGAMLIDLIESPDSGPKSTLLESALTVGQSTGPAPV